MTTDEVLTQGMYDVLQGASQLMVGVISRSGPHTTPELFATAAGRLWCMTAASTLKAKLLRHGGPVAAAVSVGNRSVVILGTASVVDAARFLDPLRSPTTSALAPLGVGRYAAKNAAELGGALFDAFTGRLGRPLPGRRVVLSIEPRAAAIVDHGEVAGSLAGPRPPGSAKAASPSADSEDLIEAVPEKLQPYALSGPGFAGWTTTTGDPLVLPGEWSLDEGRFRLPEGLMRWADGSARGSASVTRDGWTGFGPTGKQGLMLRGDGAVTTRKGVATIGLDISGVTYWDGVETGTVRAEP